MRSILQQADKAQFGEGARSATGARPAKSRFVFRGIGTSSVLPSRLTSRQSRYQAPFVRRSAIGATSDSYSAFTGSTPTRLRAWEMPDLPATFTATDGSSSHCTPSNKQRSTSR